MTTRDAVTDWLGAYERAWRSDDPDEIAALFRDDAVYRTEPWEQPWTGAAAIVDGWRERGDGGRDWSFTSEVVAVDGPTTVVRGVTTYAAERDRPERVYDNLWLVDLADDGRASAFTEFWMLRPSARSG